MVYDKIQRLPRLFHLILGAYFARLLMKDSIDLDLNFSGMASKVVNGEKDPPCSSR